MTIRTREDAVAVALATKSNKKDTCQLVTRNYFNAPSAGDFDGDGAADAEDGWKREPEWARHVGDRHPLVGSPVSYLGGSNDNGHRAIYVGNGMIRSTDAPSTGVTSTVPLDWPERNWGLIYAGWSDTIDGYVIPPNAVVEPPAPKDPNAVAEARVSMNADLKRLISARNKALAKAKLGRVKRLNSAIKELRAAINHLPGK